MKIQELIKENRPRERLQIYGPTTLTTAELLALILKSGTKKESILNLTNKLLLKYPLPELSRCSIQQLTKEHGIGKAKASELLAIFELSKRLQQTTKKNAILCAQDVATHYSPRFNNVQQEHILALYLDTKNHLIKDEIITTGILNASLIHPREIFHGAIKHCANALIVIHNHPSGDPTPSAEDLEITKRLSKTGDTLGITFLDHVIIGKNSYWSWKEGNATT